MTFFAFLMDILFYFAILYFYCIGACIDLIHSDLDQIIYLNEYLSQDDFGFFHT